MSNYIKYSKFILPLLLFILASCSSAPLNIQAVKREVVNYYESPAWPNDLKDIISKAEEEINEVKLNPNSTIVIDVDETALSNYEAIKEVNFGYVESLWNKWIDDAKAPAVPEVKGLYDYALSKNIKVVFLTGRDKSQYDATYRNLKNAGYFQFDTLILKDHSDRIATGKYKAQQREAISKKGYDIIASIGDQESDFEGDYYGIKIKLPNYLYIIK
jgi:predicted secreted acid phosphatase